MPSSFPQLGRRRVLVHRRDVIEPVEIRDRLQIGLLLDRLFGAAVQEADMRIDARDDFAVGSSTRRRRRAPPDAAPRN